MAEWKIFRLGIIIAEVDTSPRRNWSLCRGQVENFPTRLRHGRIKDAATAEWKTFRLGIVVA